MSNINIKGTANIVNACLEYKVKKLGHISSVAAIGRKGDGEYSGTIVTNINSLSYLLSCVPCKLKRQVTPYSTL